MADLIAAAPEELRHVLEKVKMSATKYNNMKSLGAATINTEMLGNTLAYLMDIQVTDDDITRLLKEGKKDMIIRQVVNMMPLPCFTCNGAAKYKPGEKPQVRCRRYARGACTQCFPEPMKGWAYLYKDCDQEVQQQQCIPEGLHTAP